MLENLLEYYERELTFLRRMGSAFSRKYPKIAQRLMLEPDKCDDPHVERVLEGVAFLAARVHRKIDEEFPEIAKAFLDSLLPHYLLPMPSMSVVQFHAKPGAWLDLPAGVMVHTRIIRSYDTRCRFRTCAPVQSWPAVVSEVDIASAGSLNLPAELQSSFVLRLVLRCTEGKFSTLKPPHKHSSIRIYLDGPRQFALYEQLVAATLTRRRHQVYLRTADGALIPLKLRPVGFEPEEGMLPYAGRSFLGYRLLQEYFAFPKKFLFLELDGFDEQTRKRLDERAEVLFLGSGAVPNITPHIDDFKLGCAPIVNLFAQPAEPINVTHAQAEYRVVADARHQDTTEIYSVDEVSAASLGRSAVVHYQALYSVKEPLTADAEPPQAYFTTSRRAGENGTEVYLSLVDLNFSVRSPGHDTLLVQTTCTNRDLAGRLPLGTSRRPRVPAKGTEDKPASTPARRSERPHDEYDLEPEGDFLPAAAWAEKIAHVDCLERPTTPMSMPLGKGVLWRLVSHLNLNYLSLEDAERGLQSLKELLQLYDMASSGVHALQIAGLTGFHTERTVARARDGLPGFCRGVAIALCLNEDHFVGGSAFLFAAMLESFFSQYVTLNSFTQLSATSDQGREIGRWPPRIGRKIAL